MNYSETLNFLYTRLPMFTRIGKAAYKANLNNTHALMEMLGHPERGMACVHIAGTNGKGSTSHFLASILQEAGYTTGLYTSPHLIDFRERIRINGHMIPQQDVVFFVEEFRSRFEPIKPSFFELTVALCFWWFRQQQPHISIIETGLGGRLDSTNVVMPLLSVITNIALDHTDLLGNTLAHIAAEKAGIIKPGIPVVLGQRHQDTFPVFQAKSAGLASPLLCAEDDWQVQQTLVKPGELLALLVGKNETLAVSSGLGGAYQQKNLPTVMKSVEVLRQAGWHISDKNIQDGLQNVTQNTGMQGRWQVLGRAPLRIADTGHNADGIAEVVAQLKATPHKKLHMVIGMVADKDIHSVLKLLPASAQYYFCRANLPRAMDAAELAEAASSYGLTGQVFASVQAAYQAACGHADAADLVFAGGSTFVVGEVLAGLQA